MIRLRPLSEAECWARCYGGIEPTVRVVKREPYEPRFPVDVTGEGLRRRFEERIDAREPELEPGLVQPPEAEAA
jgi:hypothetical protein